VVRGGSFNNNQNNARCAFRNRNNPNNRNNNQGFRVVVVSTTLCVLPEMLAGYSWLTEAIRDGPTEPLAESRLCGGEPGKYRSSPAPGS
jgi:hypothetical protein